MRKLVLSAGICALLNYSTLALAQAPAGTTPESSVTVSGVTVTAHSKEDPTRTIERIAQADGEGQLARWDSPVCPNAVGLPDAFDAFIATRIRDIGKQVGAPIAGPGCHANVLIFITPDPAGFTRQIVKLRKEALAGGRWGIDKFKLAQFSANTHPVRWLYVSGAVQATPGGAPIADPNARTQIAGMTNDGSDHEGGLAAYLGMGAGPNMTQMGNVIPSRLTPAAEQAFTQVVIVVDAKRIAGLEAGQIADYLGMVALAHVKADVGFSSSDTVLNLFADGLDDAHRPAGLRPWDRAYLDALYKADAQKSSGAQISHIAERMATKTKESSQDTK